jgi:hypothetical protein
MQSVTDGVDCQTAAEKEELLDGFLLPVLTTVIGRGPDGLTVRVLPPLFN